MSSIARLNHLQDSSPNGYWVSRAFSGDFSCQIESSVVTNGVLGAGPRDDGLPPNDNETLYKDRIELNKTKQIPPCSQTLIGRSGSPLPNSSRAGSVALLFYSL